MIDEMLEKGFRMFLILRPRGQGSRSEQQSSPVSHGREAPAIEILGWVEQGDCRCSTIVRWGSSLSGKRDKERDRFEQEGKRSRS